jgi:hypothetical protein
MPSASAPALGNPPAEVIDSTSTADKNSQAPATQHLFDRIFTMKRLILVFAIILGWASTVCAASPGTHTSLHAIRSLTAAEARQGLPVVFEATVTYYDNNGIDLFVQQGGQALYVESKPNEGLAPGDRVLVRGKTRNSFGTDVMGDSVTLLHAGHSSSHGPKRGRDAVRESAQHLPEIAHGRRLC